MTKPKRIFAATLVAALGLAACGGDDDDDDDAVDSTEAPSEETGAPSTEPMGSTPATEPMGSTPTTAPAGEMPDGSGLRVGLTFDLLGRGDQSFNDSAAAGMDRAKADFGIPDANVSEVTPVDAAARGTDLQLQADNNDLVIGVGFSFAEFVPDAAAAYPDTQFAIIDDPLMDFEATPPSPLAENAAGLVFSEEQGSYLVGVAAALKSETGKIGFIGGVSGIGLIEKFEAGYIAGAKSINPDIEIVSQYLSEFPDFGGFEDPASANDVATSMYNEGADIVYAAAGLSGSGMFQAAAAVSEETGTKVWGIGVDSDQYNTVDPAVQEYVLTSMIKRVDVAVYEIIKAHLEGTFTPGETRYDLSVDGVGYSTSGGFIDDIVPQIEEAKAAILDGSVVVPTDPAEA